MTEASKLDQGVTPELDAEPTRFDYGKGGVPWYLLIFYLSFLVFFVWYVLEYQLPDYLESSEDASGGPPPVVQEETGR